MKIGVECTPTTDRCDAQETGLRIFEKETLMSVGSWITRVLLGAPDPSAAEPAPRDERREAGRDRHHETGEPAWEESDRLDEPPGAGKRNPDAAPEILGGN